MYIVHDGMNIHFQQSGVWKEEFIDKRSEVDIQALSGAIDKS